jgi:LmbE family N-acetylglucosaminyl deacetylase
MGTTVILSPHPDDAVLSLWHVLAGPGDVRVVNVFTGAPPGAGPGWWDELSGAGDPAARAAEREAEDRAALSLAGREAVSLGFVDNQYRTVEQELEPLVEALAAELAPDDLVLAPAALGQHPDHALVRAAALALRERGRTVALYADIPHAVADGWPAWVTDGGSPRGAEDGWAASLTGAGLRPTELEPRVRDLDLAEERRKRDAVGRYETQLGALEERFSFPSRRELLRHEVVWPLPPP